VAPLKQQIDISAQVMGVGIGVQAYFTASVKAYYKPKDHSSSITAGIYLAGSVEFDASYFFPFIVGKASPTPVPSSGGKFNKTVWEHTFSF
jgi:hypothetical protein